ncbi:MAG: PEP-CTERM sorting domain-containing protein [Fimbriiglobus sp.]
MRSFLFALMTGIFCCSASNAQSIFDNPITATNPSASNPFTSGQTVDANLTVSGIGRGAGITANAGSNRYNAASWNTASFDPTAYFNWSMTPNSGFLLNLNSIQYTSERSSATISNFALRSSLDGYTSDIGSPVFGGGTISLSDPAYQNLSSNIEFRLYAWGATSSASTFSVNDFQFNGTVVPIPEPMTVLGVSAGLLAVGGWVRRRRMAAVVA